MAMLTFAGTTIVPYDNLLRSPFGRSDHEGGPIWSDWERQRAARFIQFGVQADKKPALPIKAKKVEGDNWCWIGPITGHFGHGIADFSTRIAETLATFAAPRLVFSSEPVHGYTSFSKTPAWWRDMMINWFKVSEDQIHIVNEPEHYRTLHVAPQGEHINAGAPSARYLDWLDAITKRNIGEPAKSGTVYVSRVGVAGKLAGEAAFEAALEAAGVRIFRPEQASITEQMTVYASAERLIFSEGSAVHGLQLLGRSLGDVTIISRRRGFRIGEVSIRPRSETLRYWEFIGGVVCGLTEDGRPAGALGLSLVRIRPILVGLENLGIPIKKFWDQDAYDAEVSNDLEAWLTWFRGHRFSRTEASKASVYDSMTRASLGHKVDRAKAILA